MVPQGLQFQLRPRDAEAGEHLSSLAKLIGEADAVVNACDAAREGELIFWDAMRWSGWARDLEPGVAGDGVVERLWLRTMTDGGIQEAWRTRMPIVEYQGLAQAAYARREADWLLGLNLTRAATLTLPERTGKGKVWPVGRVQTPVLAEIVRRDTKIREFSAKSFFGVEVTFGEGGAETKARLQVPGTRALDENPERFADKEDAEKWRQALVVEGANPWTATEEGKEKTEAPPRLFSLTSLQREASQRFGWSAKKTLEVAQGLYENAHITYPRTESEHLPSDYAPTADEVMGSISHWVAERCAIVWPSSSSQTGVFNDKKVSDHFAIVPTSNVPALDTDDASELWALIASRFVVVFQDSAKALHAVRRYRTQTDEEELEAIAKGKSYINRGWRTAAEGLGVSKKAEESMLGPLEDPSTASGAMVTAGETKPPKRYTEATLLAVMENCGRILEGEVFEPKELRALKKYLSDRGLGTPATRAEIIEGLIRRHLVSRVGTGKKVHLESTEAGRLLVVSLRDADLSELTLPATTGEWEEQLREIESGRGDRRVFLEGLVGKVGAMVARLRPAHVEKLAERQKEAEGVTCPASGEPVQVRAKTFLFPGFPDVACWKTIAGRQMTAAEYAATLAADLKGETGPLFEGFLSKKRKPFSARLKVVGERLEFEFDEGETATVEGVLCPKTQMPAVDCGKFFRFAGWPDLRCWKTLASRRMRPEEYSAALTAHVAGVPSGILSGFRSKKRKPFNARLDLAGDTFKFGFER